MISSWASDTLCDIFSSDAGNSATQEEKQQVPLKIILHPDSYPVFHFHLQCKRVPVCVQHCQQSVLSSFGTFAQCMDVKRVFLSYHVWHWAYFLTFKNHLFIFLSGLSILVHFLKICFLSVSSWSLRALYICEGD